MAEDYLDSQSPEDKIAETLRTAKFEAERFLRQLALDTSDDRRAYVYALFRPDGSIRYVGKGTGDRLHEHGWDGVRHDNPRLAADYVSFGKLPAIKIIDGLTHDEAFAVEETLVLLWGIEADGLGPLANLDYGGRGGAQKSAETIARISAASRASLARPETKAKLSASQKAAHRRPGSREKRGAAIKAALADPDVKARQGAGISDAFKDDERRLRRNKAISEAHLRPETNAKLRENSKENWENCKYAVRAGLTPDVIEKRNAAISAGWSPESRLRKSEEMVERQKDPAVKAAIGAKSKKMWEDPAYREKVMASRRAAAKRKKNNG